MKSDRRVGIYYFAIIFYGAVLLAVMLGAENLYGSTTDWLGQHSVFPDVFRQAFYESKQLIPNFFFQIGGGQNAFLFTYYGFLSPVILLSYLLPFMDMTMYIMSASIILYLITGVLVFVFLRRHFADAKAFMAALIFLTLSPVNYHFHHHIMFVWYLPFLILGLMGLDFYFEKKRGLLFIVSTFCLILTNYYFSVASLACLFVYAIYCILQESHLRLRGFLEKFWKLVGLFILPVMLSGFVLFPTAYALVTNSRSFAVSESLENLLILNPEDIFYSSFGMGITGLLFLAIIGNLIWGERRKCDVFLNGFLILVIVCPMVSYVLNGTLYVRGKVLIPFTILVVYAFCLFAEKIGKKSMVLSLCVLASLCLVSFGNNRKEQYVSTEYYKELYYEEIEALMKQAEEDWYRTNVSYLEKHVGNKAFGDKFYGTSVYSSTSNRLYQDFYETNMGNNEKYRNCFMTCGAQNELFYTFMGTRYIIAETDPGLYYTKVSESKHLNLYKNQWAYPMVYKSHRTISEAAFDEKVFPYTTELLMTHTVVKGGNSGEYESVIESCDIPESCLLTQQKEDKYEIVLEENYRGKILYISFDLVNEGAYKNKKDVSITINGVKNKLTVDTWQYYNGNTRFDYVIPLENTTTLTIEITEGKYNIQNLRMYTSPMIFETYSEAEHLAVNTFSDRIVCNVEAAKEEYLVTSIPYDKGFTAFINGKPSDVESVNKAFVGVQLEEGENHVVIAYTAPFFRMGVVVSLAGLLILAYTLLRKKMQIVRYLIFGVLTTVVSLLTYYFCTSYFLDARVGLQLQIANVIAWVVSVTFAYITNKKFVFQSQNAVAKELRRFYVSRLGTLFVDMGLMYLLATVAGVNDMLAKMAVQAVVIVSNYVLGKFLVFKEETYK